MTSQGHINDLQNNLRSDLTMTDKWLIDDLRNGLLWLKWHAKRLINNLLFDFSTTYQCLNNALSMTINVLNKYFKRPISVLSFTY